MNRLLYRFFLPLLLLVVIIPAHSMEDVASGSFTSAFTSWGSDSLAGDWKITQESGRYFIVLADNFKAKNGPDVKIFLSKKKAKNINGGNAAQSSVFVSLLDSFDGAAKYVLPEDINIDDFNTLVFHCEAYSKLWGTSAIK